MHYVGHTDQISLDIILYVDLPFRPKLIQSLSKYEIYPKCSYMKTAVLLSGHSLHSQEKMKFCLVGNNTKK